MVLDEKNSVNNMPFFPLEQDWTLALASRPSRIPIKEWFPATYTVNSLLALGGRKTQCSKGPYTQGKHMQTGSNNILIPGINRYGTREPGELAEDGEGIPEWLWEPINSDLMQEIANGNVTNQSKTYI